MTLTPYRQALALPGVRSLLSVAMLARIPATAASVTLTLYVVLDLRHGYFAAGAIGAALTVGDALGAPLLGRLVDRRGLRLMLGLTTATEAIFWTAAQALPYPALLVASFFGGLMSLPVFSVIRQSIAALVPEAHRRQAYALDSMSVELSFMIGPAAAMLLATAVSARIAMLAVGGSFVLSGLALYVLDPPIRSAGEQVEPGPPVPRREWLNPRLVTVLTVTAASTLVLGGTDVSIIAVLREADQLQWTGAALTMWAVYSFVGGFAYGAVSRPFSPPALLAVLALCTIPVGFSGGQWWWLCLALLPAGALCAPTMAATADAVSRLAPAGVRGEAMGLHGSAVTVGIALGAPLAGAVIDASAPAWGFAAVGLVSVAVALIALSGDVRRQRGVATATDASPELVATGR